MLNRLSIFLEAIKFSHSIFALPFALVAMLVAANGLPDWWTIFWIIVACVTARTAAMAFNRLADLRFDARNPRTQNRALVTGELSPEFMAGALLVSSVGFFFSAAMLNWTCFVLSPPTLAVLLAYSLAKRYTDYSHYILGLALGLAPIGAWIAVTESIALAPILLSLAVIAWVAGFDMLYSCQDFEVDRREEELHSMPKRLGVAGAMRAARQTHAAAAVLFLAFWWWAGLGIPTLLATAAIAVLLERQHRLVTPRDLSRLNAAFFTTNGVIAVGFLAVVYTELVVLR